MIKYTRCTRCGSRTRRRREMSLWMHNYLKAHPCVDCGETDTLVLVFDHVRGVKKYDVGRMVNRNVKAMLAEIAKCDVVCANDHMRRTAKRAKTVRWKLAKGKPI